MKKRYFSCVPPLLLALLWLLAMPACKKDARLTIMQGRITEYGTGDPIPDARVYIYCDESEFGGPTIVKLIDSIITDADGRYHREYQEDDLCVGAFLLPYKKGYFKGNEIYLTTDNQPHDVVLNPEAWFKLVTIPDAGMWESLGFGGSVSIYPVSALHGVETQIFSYPGARYLTVLWSPFSDPTVVQTDSIYIIPHDTTTYTIHY